MNFIANRRFLLVILIFIIFIMIVFVATSYAFLNKTTIYCGIKVNGIDISGLGRIEAVKHLSSLLSDEFNNRVLKFKYEDYVYKVRYENLGVSYDYYKSINNAYKIGRQGNVVERLNEILKTKIYGQDISLGVIFNEDKVNFIIEQIRKDICIKSEDAKISYSNYSFKIVPEVVGKKVDVELLRKRIINAILDSEEVVIPVENEIPEITEKLLSKIQYPIGEYSTYFGGSNEARKNNIRISALKIDGGIILPGKIFSFNKATGVRNKNTGYMESKVIKDGKFVFDVGGGVCQVSTALYNVALLSNLDIVERHHHSIPVSYVPKGEDATVSYDYLDLKIRNNYDFPLYIHIDIQTNRLTFRIWGCKTEANKNIQIISILKETIKPNVEKIILDTLAPGTRIVLQEGRCGYKVETYRVIYENGQEISRELISQDYYKPRDYIIKMGPEPTIGKSIYEDNSQGILIQ